jgi:hypothetical protein
MACKEFHLHMRQSNNEQKTIVDNILYKKTENSTKPFHIFLTRIVGTRKISLSHVLHETFYDIILIKSQMLTF